MDILVDIDGTVADSHWRENLIAEGWDVFHAAAKDDKVIHPVAAAVRCLAKQYTIIGNTGRPEKWRSPTLTWLAQQNIFFDHLIMRGPSDFRKAPEVKWDNALDYYAPDEAPDPVEFLKKSVALVIDDHPGVIAKFRGAGVNCLLVNPMR